MFTSFGATVMIYETWFFQAAIFVIQ